MKSFVRPEYEFEFDADRPHKVGVKSGGLTVWMDKAKLTDLISKLQEDVRFYLEALECLSERD